MNVADKTVVITGSSRGLGAGMAEWFHGRDAALGLCARQIPKLTGPRVVTAAVDVVDFEGLQDFAALVASELGPIDLWINNAAILEPIVAQRDLSYRDLEAHFRVNVGGVLNGTRAYLGHLEAVGHRGALVNISSGAAQRGMAGSSAYCAAKAGVDRLTETVALEEPDLLPIALAVAPGVVETAMQEILRGQDAAVLHDVEMFRDLQADDAMNSPGWVAAHITEWVFGGVDPQNVVVRVPKEPR